MNQVWRVVIIDDHPTIKIGTKLILEEQENLIVEGMASTSVEGIRLVAELQPDLVLLDYQLSEGTAETIFPEMKHRSPDSHYIILTSSEDLSIFQLLMARGASGIISKQASPAQLLHLIAGLREGVTTIPLMWLKQGVWPLPMPKPDEGSFPLTETEMKVMDRIVQGVTYDKIAAELQVSRRSIDNYLRKIYVKLAVTSRAQAIEKYTLYFRENRELYM
ncbi:response regulator transcription factor [Paenibacillus sediminis]|uniref:NarL family two-component system response regulator YdfI n=1 Tax=Paenibacillus sediminis TaxID=664909 RepID=A0ABS4H5P4_9BACL|nr:response regulator transcription factor [Paenibacillus sediminis]MBP1937859.1 NarL family two-component system response regulator YdfI [Paenibacillus sediminis]